MNKDDTPWHVQETKATDTNYDLTSTEVLEHSSP
jgi:hypothetical protein